MKKALSILLALVLTLSLSQAFALELLPAGDTYPIDTDATISWYVQASLSPHEVFADWTQSPFHTGLSEKTGVMID